MYDDDIRIIVLKLFTIMILCISKIFIYFFKWRKVERKKIQQKYFLIQSDRKIEERFFFELGVERGRKKFVGFFFPPL